jgi:hypothetical protein
MRVVTLKLVDKTTVVVIYCLTKNAQKQKLEWIATQWRHINPITAKQKAMTQLLDKLNIFSVESISSYICDTTPQRYAPCIIEDWNDVLHAVRFYESPT